jgi:hypothetical protein
MGAACFTWVSRGNVAMHRKDAENAAGVDVPKRLEYARLPREGGDPRGPLLGEGK